MSNKGWMTRDQHPSEDEGIERHEAILANVEDPPGETCREHGVRIIASANYDATEDQDEQG